MDITVFESKENNVWKYVFSSEHEVYESVLYCYGGFYERTVICCSVMSGCPVGCTFCGTGKKFIRNLTANEIIEQINHILCDKGIEDINDKGKRFQIMFMSMGEPMLNWSETEAAILELHQLYPVAELLLSTIGINKNDIFGRIIDLSREISKIGLQFSIHEAFEDERDKLIPYKNKWSLEQIRDAGIVWWNQTGRKPYLNYCITGRNNTYSDFVQLTTLFSPVVFNFTFSVVCSKDESAKEAGFRNIDLIRKFENEFAKLGYNTRIFNPAGQDDIGGGCGMLWYVQKWMREHDNRQNCNLCPRISITEEEQHKQSVKNPHVCTKYNKRVLHGNQHKGQSAVIVPCGECLEYPKPQDNVIYNSIISKSCVIFKFSC